MASSLRVNAIVPASGTNVAIGTAGGTITYSASVSGVSTFSSGIIVAAGTTAAPSISPTGDSNTGIFFPSADTIAFAEGGVEAARFDSNGRLGIGTQIPSAAINVRSSAAELARFTNTGSNGGDWEIKLGGGGFEDRKFMLTDKFGGTDNVRVSVDSSGRVIMPYQPAANWVISANTSTFVRSVSIKRDANNNVSSVAAGNGSSHGSVGRFTAPVAGVYLITIRGTSSTISGSNELLSVYGSWSTTTNFLNPTNEVLDLRCTPLINDGIGWAGTLYLSANDYWELDWYRPAPTAYVGTTLWDISTILLG